MDDEFGYIGREWCGCLSLFVADIPRTLRLYRGSIQALKRRGGTWERMTIEECRTTGPTLCPEHDALRVRKEARA